MSSPGEAHACRASGLRKPDISANSVVLPAPLGPISAAMRALRRREAHVLAPPAGRRSAIDDVLHLQQRLSRRGLRRQRAHGAADSPTMPRGRNVTISTSTDAVDHQVDAGRVAEQVARELGEQRAAPAAPSSGPHSVPMPPTIGAEQRLDRHRRAEGDVRVDVLEVLHVERAARAHEGAREHDRAELDAERVDAERRAPRPRCRAPPAARRRSASGAATR